MQITISPSTISGKLDAQASKSYMQRAIVAAMLANGQSKLIEPCLSDDSKNMLNIAEKLGAKITRLDNEILITGKIADKGTAINVGESGLAMRLLIPVLSTIQTEFVIDGRGSLLDRKLDIDTSILTQLGIAISTNNGQLPVGIKGKISAGKIKIDASGTSQFLSGLLFALPLLEHNSEVIVDKLNSKPYIDLSIEILNKFGIEIENRDYKHFFIKGNQKYQAQSLKIEKDWSGVAFMLVAAAIAGKIELRGLNIKSTQADKKILAVLKDVGANLIINDGIIAVKKAELNAFDFDATHCPDLFPPLVVLAINCKGKSTISGVKRLVNKESNRAKALVSEFTRLGAEIKIKGNKMVVHGGKLNGGHVFSHKDHRIAMALAVAGLNANADVLIENCDCVSKSYPLFFEDLNTLSKNKFRFNNYHKDTK